MDLVEENHNPSTTLRFRLDKTIKTNVPLKSRICNLNCIWCHHDYMSHTEGYRNAISNQEFLEGVLRVIAIAQPSDVYARISGDGEPTLVGEEELTDLIQKLRQIPQIKTIKLTTNGLLLGNLAPALKESGLDSVTVSINSMDRHIYAFYSGFDSLNLVLHSIEQSLLHGISTKLNVIYSRLNIREINEFIRYAQDHSNLVLKFFELIPSDDLSKRLYLSVDELEKRLEPISQRVVEFNDAYIGKNYYLWNGGLIQVKSSGYNNCPNLKCLYRAGCLEGCRSSIRLRADGILQPCGVRTDNRIDLFSPSTSDEQIIIALKSGGKLS